jgi:hypothetical protein
MPRVSHLLRRNGVYPYVQAISVAIDQYAAKVFGNREYFLNKPYGIGGSGRKEDVS